MQESKDEIARELRAKEIYRIGRAAYMDWAKIENAIIQDRSLDDFKSDALEHMRKLNDSNLGSHAAPEDNFSLVRFIRDKIEGKYDWSA